ncbi:MAG: polysaccharide biosynthesis/export family protein [Acidobacteriota bacterium]
MGRPPVSLFSEKNRTIRAARAAGRLALLILLGFCFAGCAARTPVEAPHIVTEPLPKAEAPPYRLQAGDLIAVKFWNASELDEEVRVRPDGKISLPFIDEVAAAGLTPEQLDQNLTGLYAAELARPNITVIVREALPPRIFVGGEVGRQGVVELAEGLTLFRAIQEAGGLTPTARAKQILLIRGDGGGTPQARAIDLRPVMSGQEPSLDVVLAANDVIFVPRTRIRSVALFVEQYINDIIPLQNVLSGLLLADLTDDDDGGTTSPAVPPASPEDSTPP